MLAAVLFFVTIMFDEARPKVLCIHTELIIVCRVCCGSKNNKNDFFLLDCDIILKMRLDLTISGKQSNYVGTMLRSAPYL